MPIDPLPRSWQLRADAHVVAEKVALTRLNN
jgi:hypothetical protein